MIFVLNVKTLKSDVFVVTRLYIAKNATEDEFSIIKTPIKEIDNKKRSYIITRIKKLYLKCKKKRRERDKKRT